MAIRIVPPSKNSAAAYLTKLFSDTEQKLINEIIRKRRSGYVDYAETAALTRVRRTLLEMTGKAEKYVPLAIEKEFYKQPGAQAGYENARSMITNPVSTLAIEQLTDNLLGEIRDMAGKAYTDTTAKLALLGRPDQDIFRELGISKALETMALGRGPMSATNAIIAALRSAGITAFTDKAGRNWGLGAYGSMAVRTTVRQAQVSAVLTSDDHDLYRIVRHYAPCRLCAVYADRVYSKSGKNPNYPPLAMAFGKIDPTGADDLSNTFLNIHPNCLCTLVRYTEAGKTEQEIQKMREQSSFEKHPADVDPRSKKEIAAYQQKERDRAAFRADFRQWERYRELGLPGVPKTFKTFQKYKAENSELYRSWKAQTAALRADLKNTEQAPIGSGPFKQIRRAIESSIYPESANIEEAFSNIKGLPKQGRQLMTDILSTAESEEAKKVFRNYGPRLVCVDARSDKNRFSRSAGGVYVNLVRTIQGDDYSRPGEILFHEFAHMIDWLGNFKDPRRYLSQTEVNHKFLRTVLRQDFDAFKAANSLVENSTDQALAAMLKSEGHDIYTIGALSDIIEGLTGLKKPLGYGHPKDYFTAPGKLEREFFAEVLSTAAVNKPSYEQLQRVFPHAVQWVWNSLL